MSCALLWQLWASTGPWGLQLHHYSVSTAVHFVGSTTGVVPWGELLLQCLTSKPLALYLSSQLAAREGGEGIVQQLPEELLPSMCVGGAKVWCFWQAEQSCMVPLAFPAMPSVSATNSEHGTEVDCRLAVILGISLTPTGFSLSFPPFPFPRHGATQRKTQAGVKHPAAGEAWMSTFQEHWGFHLCCRNSPLH